MSEPCADCMQTARYEIAGKPLCPHHYEDRKLRNPEKQDWHHVMMLAIKADNPEWQRSDNQPRSAYQRAMMTRCKELAHGGIKRMPGT